MAKKERRSEEYVTITELSNETGVPVMKLIPMAQLNDCRRQIGRLQIFNKTEEELMMIGIKAIKDEKKEPPKPPAPAKPKKEKAPVKAAEPTEDDVPI